MKFKRRGRWLVLSAGLAVVGLGGATWHRLGLDLGAASRPASAASGAPAGSSVRAAGVAAEFKGAAASPEDAHPRMMTTAASAPGKSMEICGVGTITDAEIQRLEADPVRGRARAQEIEAQLQRRAETGVARIAARLAAGHERQQVAARLLMKDADAAAVLAERSSDALTYQMALSGCSAARDAAPHCARLSARRWAELDPTDARPWLRLMAEALARKDVAAVDTALAEAAARPRLSRGDFLLEAQAVAVVDALGDGAELGHALVAIIGIDAAMQPFDMSAPLKACSSDALRDTVRLGHCRALARQVLASTGDLGEASAAQRLADRMGVPREQQAYDKATLDAAQARFIERTTVDMDMSCATLGRFRQLSVERAAGGDLPLALAELRQRTAASGTSR